MGTGVLVLVVGAVLVWRMVAEQRRLERLDRMNEDRKILAKLDAMRRRRRYRL